jgi:hypothetical protein
MGVGSAGGYQPVQLRRLDVLGVAAVLFGCGRNVGWWLVVVDNVVNTLLRRLDEMSVSRRIELERRRTYRVKNGMRGESDNNKEEHAHTDDDVAPLPIGHQHSEKTKPGPAGSWDRKERV